MEFILSKIISRAPRTIHSDCDITIIDKNDVPSNLAENTIYHNDNGFDDNAALSGDIDTVNNPSKAIMCMFVFASFND